MNEPTKTLRFNTSSIIYYVASAILPFTTNGTNRVNVVVLLLLCSLLFIKICFSDFRIYLSKNAKNVIFTVILFSSPAIGFIWNQGYSAGQSEFIYSNFVYVWLLLSVSITFILIIGDIRSRNHCFQTLIVFLFIFILFSCFYILEASKKFDLRVIYLYYNTGDFSEFLNNPFLGNISLGAWWDLVVSLPFIILYALVILPINSQLMLIKFFISFLFLLAIGSRGALVLYVFNFIVIRILYNNQKQIFNLKLIIKLIITFAIFIGVFIYSLSFIDITTFSIFQRSDGDLTKDSGRFEMWLYFLNNLDKIYLFSNSLLPGDVLNQISFHNYFLDSTQLAGILGLILATSACVLAFKSSTTYLTKLITFTIVTSKLCGIPPFGNFFTYIILFSLYPILNILSYEKDFEKSLDS